MRGTRKRFEAPPARGILARRASSPRSATAAAVSAALSTAASARAGLAYLGFGWWAGYGPNAPIGRAMMLASPLFKLGPAAQWYLWSTGRFGACLAVSLLSLLLALASLALLGPLLFGLANP